MSKKKHKICTQSGEHCLDGHKHTFNTGLDFSAIDFKSSRAALVATDVRADGAGAKAAADPITRERRESFMVDSKNLGLVVPDFTRRQKSNHVWGVERGSAQRLVPLETLICGLMVVCINSYVQFEEL